MPEFVERSLPVGGLTLYVDDWGAGPPVVLAHGMWCDAGMFTGLARLLAPRARVLVPDFRAHGRSDVPGEEWSVGDLADDLAAMLDQLGVGPVLLAGFSMGGMMAVEFAVRHPDRLTGLVMIGSSASAEDVMRRVEIASLAKLISLTGAPHFLPEESSKATFSKTYRKKHPEEVRRWEGVVRAMSPAALTQALHAVGRRRHLLGQIDQVRVPLTIVTGEDDRVVRPKLSEMIHRRVPSSRLVRIPGAGHAVPTERPEEIAPLIEALLPPNP